MIIKLECHASTFRPVDVAGVRWLDWDFDYEPMRVLRAQRSIMLSRADWEESRQLGYRFCAIFDQQTIMAVAAEYRFSEGAWMLAGVYTQESHRLLALGTKVSSFVTGSILEAGRPATCATAGDNFAMQRTAAKLGYFEVGSA